MKTKLTPAEVQLMSVVRDKWIERAFNSPAPNKEDAIKAAHWLYELSGLAKPIVIVLNSPYACQIAANILVDSQVRSQVRSQVYSQVYSQVRSQVYSQVDSQVYSQVDSQVYSQVYSQIRSQVDSQVYSQVDSQIRSQVDSQVYSQVDSQIRSQVDSQQLNSFSFCADDLAFASGWAAFYDYFKRVGIVKNEKLDKYLAWLEVGPFMVIMLKEACIISACPVSLKRDENNRLHCVNGPAIAFADGYCQHYVRGVFFSPTNFKKFFENKADWNDIIALRDSDQRAAVIQEYGFENVLGQIEGCKVLDELTVSSGVDGKPCTYQVIEVPMGDSFHRIVKVECHTTHNVTTLGVPRSKETEKCLGAIAWTFGMSEKEYVLEAES